MKVTVITPFYEGGKYISEYVACMKANAEALQKKGHDLQVIVVNDSPWEKVHVKDCDFDICILENPVNQGIHQSRVNGLKKADGQYIMFLDQDDLIDSDALCRMVCGLESSDTRDAEYASEGKCPDVLVSNARLEQSDGSFALWYRTPEHKRLVGDLFTYTRVGIQIISPGQCLIKKSSIPDFWCQKIVGKNGADDYFLWLLMLADGAAFKYFEAEGTEALYTHKYTQKNLSADTTVTDASTFEFMDYLKDYESFSASDLRAFRRMITYKNRFRASNTFGKAILSLGNLDLFLENLKFKRKTRTGYGFNR